MMPIFNTEYKSSWHVIECDFTQSDCWFWNYYWRNNTTHTPWRDSWWLYIQSSNDSWTANWKIPQSIYSKWTLKKIVIELYSQWNWNGWWIAIISSDSPCTRTRWNLSQLNWTIESNWSWSSSIWTQNPAWWYIFTIDLEKWEAYTDKSSNKLSISSHVTTIRSNFSSWNLALCVMKWNSSYTSYLRNATFYLS